VVCIIVILTRYGLCAMVRKGYHEILGNKCDYFAGETQIETGDMQITCGVFQSVPLLSL
jgi:hypothetical protein